MGHWNYRLCRSTYKDEVFYDIREVHYNENNEIWAVTERAISPFGETIQEVKWALEKMQECLSKDVIDLDNLKFSPRYINQPV